MSSLICLPWKEMASAVCAAAVDVAARRVSNAKRARLIDAETNIATASLRSTVHTHGVEMRDDLVEMHDVDVLVMEGEAIDLMCELGAVEGAFLNQRHVETI